MTLVKVHVMYKSNNELILNKMLINEIEQMLQKSYQKKIT